MDKFVFKKRPAADQPTSSESAEPSKKKVKQSTKYSSDYTKKWPFIKPSTKGESHVKCVPCNSDFSIASGGENDIARHLKTDKHVDNVKCCDSNKDVDIGNFFAKEKDLSVIRSEVLTVKFLVDNNIPLAVSDKLGSFLREVCPDSDIAKKFACARTKTTAIVKCMGRYVKDELVVKMKNNAFSIATDGSNDHNSKLYPMVVTINNEATECVTTELLSVPELDSSSTAVNISKLVLRELSENKIPLQNCIAFMSDNASVMVGKKGGVSTLLKKEQPNMLSLGCGCHLINLAVKKAVSELPLKIEEFLMDLFYYFHHSDKRKSEFEEFQILYNDEAKQILKHCATRWLSLTTSLQRVMELWKPLVKYFNKAKEEASAEAAKKQQKCNEKKDAADSVIDSWFETQTLSSKSTTETSQPTNAFTAGRLDRIHTVLNSKQSAIYCAFLLWIMPTFDKFNKLLQSEEPQIHKLRDIYLSLYRDILLKFVKPDIVSLHSNDVTKVKFMESQTHIQNIYCGQVTTRLLDKCKPKQRHETFSAVIGFYQTALQYMVDKFPLKEQTLQHAQFLDVDKRQSVSFDSVLYFSSKLPNLSLSQDKLHEEFTNYQSCELPQSVTDSNRADKQWNLLLNHTDKLDNSTPFHHLARLATSVLSIPHSNASAERMFSLVRKNRTEARSSMSTETLDALLVNKAKKGRLTLTDQFLRKCKTATRDSLQASSSSTK